MNGMAALKRLLGLAVGVAVCGALLAYGVTEEVKVGGIGGSVAMLENGRALPKAWVTLEPVYNDDESPVRIHHTETDTSGKFRISGVVAGDYLLTITGKAHEMSRTPVKIADGKVLAEDYKLKPTAPYLDLYASQRVFTPSEAPTFQLKGFFDKGGVKINAYKLDFNKVVKEGSLYNALAPLARADYNTKKIKDPLTMGSLASTWEQPLTQRDVEGVFVEPMKSKVLPEGIYWLQAKGPNLTAGTWFVVSKIALVGKHAGDDALAYVTDIVTGQAVPNASVGYADETGFHEAGKTSAEGIAHFSLNSKKIMIAAVGESKAFVDLNRYDDNKPQLRVVGYTDRTIYRPGDTVYYKGLVRQLKDKAYTILPAQKVPVELRDEDDNVVSKATVPLNDMGSYAGQFSLSKEASPGYYSVVATVNDSEYRTSVSVAAYRKPTYSIVVTPEKPFYVQGDHAKMKVKAEYYFGGPVPGAKVEAYIYREAYWDPALYDPDYAEYFADTAEGTGGDFVGESKNLVTDDRGEAIVEFDTKADGEADLDYRYNVSVSIVDEGGKYFDGSGSVQVMRGDFGLSVEPSVYIQKPNTPIPVTIRASSLDGKSLSQTQVELTYGIRVWNGENDEFYKPQKQTVTLGPDGTATVNLTCERGGSFDVEARAKDSRGNQILGRGNVWIDGVLADNAMPETKLTVEVDKKKYGPGDNVKALISCDKPGGQALVTIEADQIYDTKVVSLTSKAITLDFPVDVVKYTPNVFISVAYVKNKEFSEAQRKVVITDPSRKLKIDIKADKSNYHPGDVATYEVTTQTESGQPTPAEVSVGVVDESIYALSEDHLDLLKEFYPIRYNQVETQYSFPDLYLDGGDKAPTSVQVRRLFKDTAFWAPTVLTDASGHASVTVQLPDNLTTWRATATGITAKTEVGRAVTKVMSNKDLMVRLETPAFMVGTDQQMIKAVIHNNTGQDATIKVQLQAEGVQIDGNLSQDVTIPKSGVQTVTYMATPKVAGTAVFTAKAWIDGGASDGVEAKVPVQPHGRTVAQGFAGDSTVPRVIGVPTTTCTAAVSMNLQAGADPGVGLLHISVMPSLASTLAESLDGLIDFPYGCVEQTMSRFLPTVLVSQSLSQAGWPKPSRAAQIPQMVSDGYTRLNGMQHSDGSWGWWEYGEGDPFMTAYVLDGFHQATLAGFPANKRRIERAAEWATKYLKEPLPIIQPSTSKWEKEYKEQARKRVIDDRAYLAYALAVNGFTAPAQAYFATTKPATSTLVAAYTAMSRKAAGQDATEAINSLVSQATVTGAVARWEENYWGVETTARAFNALISVNPQHPLVPKVARFLLERRKGRMWWSTRDTSFALMGLSRYVAQTKELGQIGTIAVKLNGQVVGTINVTPTTIGQETKVDLPISNLKAGNNDLEFAGQGLNHFYYAAELKQVVVSEQLPARPIEGLSVERNYYKLQARKFEDGATRLGPGKTPILTGQSGDLVQVQLTIHSDRPRDYVLIEDPIPSSCRVTEREDVANASDWTYWWDKLQIYDNRVAIFVRNLPAGDKTVTYTLRVENPGFASALPTSISNMYDPDAVASGAALRLEVKGP